MTESRWTARLESRCPKERAFFKAARTRWYEPSLGRRFTQWAGCGGLRGRGACCGGPRSVRGWFLWRGSVRSRPLRDWELFCRAWKDLADFQFQRGAGTVWTPFIKMGARARRSSSLAFASLRITTIDVSDCHAPRTCFVMLGHVRLTCMHRPLVHVVAVLADRF